MPGRSRPTTTRGSSSSRTTSGAATGRSCSRDRVRCVSCWRRGQGGEAMASRDPEWERTAVRDRWWWRRGVEKPTGRETWVGVPATSSFPSTSRGGIPGPASRVCGRLLLVRRRQRRIAPRPGGGIAQGPPGMPGRWCSAPAPRRHARVGIGTRAGRGRRLRDLIARRRVGRPRGDPHAGGSLQALVAGARPGRARAARARRVPGPCDARQRARAQRFRTPADIASVRSPVTSSTTLVNLSAMPGILRQGMLRHALGILCHALSILRHALSAIRHPTAISATSS